VTVLSWDATRGTLTELQKVSTLPDGYSAPSTAAEVRLDPSGRFLYASNRGANTLAVFSVDAATGELTQVQQISTQGKFPRNFEFDPTGRWIVCANQDGNNAVVFRIDENTGRLTQTGQAVSVPTPYCPRFLPVR